MPPSRTPLKLVPLGDPVAFRDRLSLVDDKTTLRELLEATPALSTTPVEDGAVDLPIRRFQIQILAGVPASQEVFIPHGLTVRAATAAPTPTAPPPPATTPTPTAPAPLLDGHPKTLSPREAVALAYGPEIAVVGSYLRAGLSVLVVCDKLVVPYLWDAIPKAARANMNRKLLEMPDDGGEGRSLRQRQLAQLKTLIAALPDGEVLVVPHLDLLAGGTDGNLATEARELVELLYHVRDGTHRGPEPLLLAFCDPSLTLPEVLAARFSVRYQLTGVPQRVVDKDKSVRSLGQALVTADEANNFSGYNPDDLYKNVAGMSPVRLRQAIAYAVNEAKPKADDPQPVMATVKDLYKSIRAFKKQTSANFEVPNVRFDQIGGYARVKAELLQALKLMVGGYSLPDGLPPDFQRELIPRGFLFYGPPGTGKTLFAKAVANFLNATIQVVSGPEVTDMYVGESERKLREIFAEARRNAPAVVVFDEFDSIATKRSGRDDGGSRAGNAIVAQILTEMDGFRPDVPMLVIGTTNRLDIIDEALLRPSRFRPIPIDLPDLDARRAIARIHADHFRVPVPPGLVDIVAHATEAMNGDEIRAVFRDACVGQYCQDPPVPADAYRLGFLVGQLREARQRREMEASANRRPTAAPRPRPAAPAVPGPTAPAPAESWVSLSPPAAPEATAP